MVVLAVWLVCLVGFGCWAFFVWGVVASLGIFACFFLFFLTTHLQTETVKLNIYAKDLLGSFTFTFVSLQLRQNK